MNMCNAKITISETLHQYTTEFALHCSLSINHFHMHVYTCADVHTHTHTHTHPHNLTLLPLNLPSRLLPLKNHQWRRQQPIKKPREKQTSNSECFPPCNSSRQPTSPVPIITKLTSVPVTARRTESVSTFLQVVTGQPAAYCTTLAMDRNPSSAVTIIPGEGTGL